MRWEFHPEAEQEFIETSVRYEAKLAGLGQRFGLEVEHVIGLLMNNPRPGAPLDNDLRSLCLGAFLTQLSTRKLKTCSTLLLSRMEAVNRSIGTHARLIFGATDR